MNEWLLPVFYYEYCYPKPNIHNNDFILCKGKYISILDLLRNLSYHIIWSNEYHYTPGIFTTSFWLAGSIMLSANQKLGLEWGMLKIHVS